MCLPAVNAGLRSAGTSAGRRRLVMEADGALEKKLRAYMKVNELYANAIQGYKVNWLPSVNMDGNYGSETAGSGA